MQFLSTNDGPHSADKWAVVTTNEILGMIHVDPSSNSPEAVEARLAKEDIRSKMIRLFTEHHGNVQKHERDKPEGLDQPLDPAGHLSKLDDPIDALFKGTPFAEHFGKPEVRQVLHQVVGQHMADIMHIERRYHADKKEAK